MVTQPAEKRMVTTSTGSSMHAGGDPARGESGGNGSEGHGGHTPSSADNVTLIAPVRQKTGHQKQPLC